MQGSTAPSSRARVVRAPKRAHYDRTTIDAILREGLYGHLGLADEHGPVVIPVSYGFDGTCLYVHGATSARFIKALRASDVCLTVTLLDGLVLARSAFHHSMNYRSVVVFGRAREVVDPRERARAFDTIVEHIVPGRTRDARKPNERELLATTIFALGIEEASAKVRTGGPLDDDEDLGVAAWAGVIPFALQSGTPVADPLAPSEAAVPDYVCAYER